MFEVIKEMYSSNGFEGIPDIKFEEEVNGDTVAARGEQSGVIYIDLEELLGKTPTEVVSILVHESVHSEKITQSSGSKLTEEIFVKDKESQVADKFKEEKEGLSEKEQKEQEEYLAKLDKENEGLREYSDNLEADSFSEEVEGYDQGTKDYKEEEKYRENIKKSWTKTIGKDVNKFLLKYLVPEKVKQLPFDVANYVTYCAENGHNPANIYGGDTKQAALNDSKIGLLPTLSFEEYNKKTKNPVDTLKALSSYQGTVEIGKEVIDYVSMIWNASKATWKTNAKVNGKIPIEDFNKIKANSIHNVDSDILTLGKYEPTIKPDGTLDWSKAGTNSYNKVAGNTTYFDMGSDWDKVQKKYNLSNDEMFEMFNKPVLDEAAKKNKIIRFSHDPRNYDKNTAISKEWEYIKNEYGYKKLKKVGEFWIGTK